MSELKTYIAPTADGTGLADYYLKSEADKVIALLTDKANYNEYAYKHKSEEFADICRFYEDELRHQKFKRCLDNARWCKERYTRYNFVQKHSGFDWSREIDFYFRWHNRWLELAEKFKEAK